MDWKKDHNPMTRTTLAYEVAKKVERYLESMVRSRCREIACPVLLKSEPQKSHRMAVSVPDPTITSSTTLGGPRAEHTIHRSLSSQSTAAAMIRPGW